MYEFTLYVHRRCQSSTIVVVVVHRPSSADFIRFWAHTISFLFWLAIAILYGTVELLTKNS